MKNRMAITTIANGKPSAPLVLRGDLEKVIKQASGYGYDALEIHVIDAKAFNIDRVNTLRKEYSVDIASIVTGQIYVRRGFSLTHPDKANRDQAISELKDYIDLAARLDAKDGVVIGWVRGIRPNDDDGAYDQLLSEGLIRIGKYAEAKSQKILLEVINRYEINVFNTASETLDFIVRYNIPNTYVHLDTFHMNIEEADAAESIRLCGNMLGYIHFADSNRLYPGAGHFDFKSVMQAISDTGYTGSLSLECIPLPDSETAAKEGLRNLRSFM